MPTDSNITGLIAASLIVSLPVQAELNIFACEPEWSSLSKLLAPAANIYTATTAFQDPHQAQNHPDLMTQMRNADLAVCSGAGLETDWLPSLQIKSANPTVQKGQPGLFLAAQQIEIIERIDHADLTMGDVHPDGNPHFHLDPYRILEIANQLSQRMEILDPIGAEQYKKEFRDFSIDWKEAIKFWEREALPVKGIRVIGYHSSFNYLFNWLGISMMGDIEPNSERPLPAEHKASLLKLIQEKRIDAIIYASYQDKTDVEWLGRTARITVIRLPFRVGESEESKDLYGLYNSIIDNLLTFAPKK